MNDLTSSDTIGVFRRELRDARTLVGNMDHKLAASARRRSARLASRYRRAVRGVQRHFARYQPADRWRGEATLPR